MALPSCFRHHLMHRCHARAQPHAQSACRRWLGQHTGTVDASPLCTSASSCAMRLPALGQPACSIPLTGMQTSSRHHASLPASESEHHQSPQVVGRTCISLAASECTSRQLRRGDGVTARCSPQRWCTTKWNGSHKDPSRVPNVLSPSSCCEGSLLVSFSLPQRKGQRMILVSSVSPSCILHGSCRLGMDGASSKQPPCHLYASTKTQERMSDSLTCFTACLVREELVPIV
jgi:hypothetical protein